MSPSSKTLVRFPLPSTLKDSCDLYLPSVSSPIFEQLLPDYIPKRNPSLWFSAAAKLLQLCLTLCDHIDGSPPGSTVPGILQARTLEWVAISFSNARK